jgi:hypothetical protein
MPRCKSSSISGRYRELVGVDCLVAGCQAAVDLAQHPGRRDPHRVGLLQRRLGIAHARVELRQMDLLQLQSPAAGQFLVEVLPRAAERLPCALGFHAQPSAMRTRRVGNQLLVELVAIGRDERQQRAKRHVRVVASRTISAGAGCHEDGAGQHGRRLRHQFVVRFVVALRLFDTRQQRIERDLLQHEAAIIAAVVHPV